TAGPRTRERTIGLGIAAGLSKSSGLGKAHRSTGEEKSQPKGPKWISRSVSVASVPESRSRHVCLPALGGQLSGGAISTGDPPGGFDCTPDAANLWPSAIPSR